MSVFVLSSGNFSSSIRRDDDIWQHGMEVGDSVLDSVQHCLYVLPEVKVVHPAAIDDGVHEGCVLRCLVASTLQPVLASPGYTTEAAFHGIVPDIKHTTGQEGTEAPAVVEQIV